VRSTEGGMASRLPLALLILFPLVAACSTNHPDRPAPTELQAQPPATTAMVRSTPPSMVPAASPQPSERTPVGEVRYVFPVQPAEKASYGHTHHDYPATDIFAPCGTTVVSPVDGHVNEVSMHDGWDPAVNDGATRGGLSVSVVGDDGVRYYGSHLAYVASDVRSGVRVRAGQVLGGVGHTGDARGVPCHLHFGLSPPRGPGDWRVRRGVVYPWPYLDSWRVRGQRSPAAEVATWAKTHPVKGYGP
jgi:peptidoglycan LD-endopeptidase LytH